MARLRLATSACAQVARGALVIVPVGAVEQGDPHLPLDSRTEIVTAVAEGAARVLQRGGGSVLIAPPVAYGSGGSFSSAAGAISIAPDVLRLLLVEIGRSVRGWSGRVVFITAHEPNREAIDGAVKVLVKEGQEASWVACGDAPTLSAAARVETSLMLHLRRWDVRRGHVSSSIEETDSADQGGEVSELAGRELLDSMSWDVAHRILTKTVVG